MALGMLPTVGAMLCWQSAALSLDPELDRFRQAKAIPGMAVVLMQNGRTRYAKGFVANHCPENFNVLELEQIVFDGISGGELRSDGKLTL